MHSELCIMNYYTWGLDLSGTLQRMGGIGGLLCVDNNDSLYFPAYDSGSDIGKIFKKLPTCCFSTKSGGTLRGKSFYLIIMFVMNFGSLGGTHKQMYCLRVVPVGLHVPIGNGSSGYFDR